ncbi:MAG TPA: universal stress protein [Burkholderiaceae bacterium]|nr:universal stress protein [Burkholderiaceae bacterium]
MDALKSLMVHVDAGTNSEARLRVARQLAGQHAASLTAVYAVTPTFVQIPLELAAGAPAVEVMQQIDEDRLAVARNLVQRLGKEQGPSIDWQPAQGAEPIRCFSQRALYADLMVLGQYDPEQVGLGVPADFAASVLIATGRPGLVVPYIDHGDAVGRCALVAWKPTPSSMHAVAGALPLLSRSSEVHVASWSGSETEPDDDPNAIIEFLVRRGIRARLHHSQEEAPSDVGEMILSLAADLSADLLVMGCYGHSRARELVLGGATRTVLKSMTVPVLMAH